MPPASSPNSDRPFKRSQRSPNSDFTKLPGSTLSVEISKLLAPGESQGELGRIAGYRILELLGRGGMGLVFLAEDIHLGRKVALKLMTPELAHSQTARERFFREARAMASVKHDHICMIHQVGEDRGIVFLAMEYLQGETLDDFVAHKHPLPISEVIRITRQITLGLSCLHDQGIIHRDIKPSNIWVEDPSGRVKLMDFGLAQGSSLGATGLTEEGSLVGTPAFMAPEQVEGESYDHRVDLFSLGCVVYHILCEKTPFRGDSAVSILYSLLHQQPVSIESERPDLPRRVVQLVNRLIKKDPNERPRDTFEVLEILDRIELGLSATETIENVRPTPTIESKPKKRRPIRPKKKSSNALIWAIGAGITGFVFLVILIVALSGKNRDRFEDETDPRNNIAILPKKTTPVTTNTNLKNVETKLPPRETDSIERDPVQIPKLPDVIPILPKTIDDPLAKLPKFGTKEEPKQTLTLKDWGKVFDPLNDCKIEIDGQKLSMTIPGKLHDFQPALPLNAPRVLREIEGDFRFEIKIDPLSMPPNEVIKPAVTPYQSAGILLYQDAKTFFRFERAASWGKERFGRMIRIELIQSGKHVSNWAFTDTFDGPVYLYLEREGDRLKPMFSTDRKKGTLFNPIELPLPPKVQIGVLGVNTTPSEMTIHFSNPIFSRKSK